MKQWSRTRRNRLKGWIFNALFIAGVIYFCFVNPTAANPTTVEILGLVGVAMLTYDGLRRHSRDRDDEQ